MPGIRNAWAWLIQRVLHFRRTVFTAVLVLGVLLSAIAFFEGEERTRLELEEAFRRSASESFADIKEELQEAVNSGASVADLYQTFGSVNQDQFRGFVGPHLARAPAIFALVWAPRVQAGVHARAEAAGQRGWRSELPIFEGATHDRPTDRRREYFPVYYWESLAGPDTSGIVGRDLGAAPASLEALQRARDTGQPAMTASLRLITGEKAIHAYWPIYRLGAPRRTVAERRENLRGILGAIFKVEELMVPALGDLVLRGISVALFDEDAPAGERGLANYPSRLKDPPPSWLGQGLVQTLIRARLQWTGRLEVGGRQLAVTFTPTAGYISARVSSDAWETLLVGLVITGLIGGFLLLLMWRTDEVERLVASRTQELQQALTERTRAEDAARTHAAQLEAVHTVSLEVIREMNLSEVLELVARQAVSLLPTGTSTVWLWAEEEQALVPRAWHGTGEWRRAARLRLGEGVVGTVAARTQGLVVNDYRTSPYALPFFLERTCTSAVVAEPLIYRGRLLGVLGLNNEATGRPFTDEDRQILALFAPQAAIAIHTAQLFDQVAEGREQARRLTQQVLTVQEEERRHLSRELHDEAGQALMTLVLNLKLIEEDVPGDQMSLRQRIREANELAQATVERIRLLAGGLRPPGLDTLGLNTSLKGLCQDVARRAGVAVRYTGSEVSPLPDAVAICLYRFLQEALTNVVKHAQANRVRVALRRDAESVRLSVADNGHGFDPWALKPPRNANGNGSRLGLLGMRERLELVGGRSEIVSRPGQGTRLVAWVPVREVKAIRSP